MDQLKHTIYMDLVGLVDEHGGEQGVEDVHKEIAEIMRRGETVLNDFQERKANLMELIDSQSPQDQNRCMSRIELELMEVLTSAQYLEPSDWNELETAPDIRREAKSEKLDAVPKSVPKIRINYKSSRWRVCSECSQYLCNQSALAYHLDVVHAGNIIVFPNFHEIINVGFLFAADKDKKVPCDRPKCQRKFLTKSNMIVHKKNHKRYHRKKTIAK